MTGDSPTDIATDECHGAPRFVRMVKANISGRCGESSLAKVAFCFVTEFLCTLGHVKFQISFGETDQTGFGVVEGFAVDIKIVIMVGGTDTVGILALKTNVAREK